MINVSLKAARPPSKNQVHGVADWLELRVLAGEDGECTFSDLPAFRRERRDTGAAEAATASDVIAAQTEGLGDDDHWLGAVIDDETSGADEPSLGDQPERDAADDDDPEREYADEEEVLEGLVLIPGDHAEVGDVRQHVQSRLNALGSARYPFIVQNDSLVLRAPLTQAHRSYLGLLLSSNLNRLDKKLHHDLTTSFERLGAHALRNQLGPWYRVEQFGTATFIEDRYGKPVRQSLPRLAEDLGWPLQDGIMDVLAASGDRGLDLVGFHIGGTGDTGHHWPVFFGQCGVGKDWGVKQDEVSQTRWRKILNVTGPLQSVLLIPYWQRKTGGALERADWINVETVLIDRLRILRLLRTTADHSATTTLAWASFTDENS